MKMSYRRRRRRTAVALRENQWLLPAIGMILGAMLALALGTFDRNPDPNDWAITVDRARDTMMSILAILFTGLAIVLSLATMTAQAVASRFSLRLLRVHLRSLADKLIIAIFTMTTTFIVIEQMRMVSFEADDLAPRTSVFVSGLLLIISGMAIIWHINHTLQTLRADRTIRRVTASTRRAAAARERQRRNYATATDSELVAPPGTHLLMATESGYFVGADLDELSELATHNKLVICVNALTGSHIVAGEPFGWVEVTASDDLDHGTQDAIAGTLDIRASRDPKTDVGFGIRILVDIALMALSPAINDPYTAVQSIDQMTILLADVAGRPTGPIAWEDDGTRRVIVREPTLAEYLDEATSQILTYGASDQTVMQALRRLPSPTERRATSPADRQAVRQLDAIIERAAIRVTEPAASI